MNPTGAVAGEEAVVHVDCFHKYKIEAVREIIDETAVAYLNIGDRPDALIVLHEKAVLDQNPVALVVWRGGRCGDPIGYIYHYGAISNCGAGNIESFNQR